MDRCPDSTNTKCRMFTKVPSMGMGIESKVAGNHTDEQALGRRGLVWRFFVISRLFLGGGLDTLRAGGTNPIQILNCTAGRGCCTASSPFHTWAMPTAFGTSPQKMPNGTCGQDVSCKQNGLRRPGCFMSDDSSEVYPVGIPLPVT
mgnify:CR=1 FL=1